MLFWRKVQREVQALPRAVARKDGIGSSTGERGILRQLYLRKGSGHDLLFWARVVGDIPGLQKHRFPLMIDDAEPAVHLAVRAQAPNLVQLEGWSHRFRDIDRYLRTKGYGEEAINYFKVCITLTYF